jgi:amidase
MAVACARIPDEEFAGIEQAVRAGAPTEGSDAARHLGWLTQSKRAWHATDEERAGMRARWAEYFEDVDALLCPVCPVTAIPHDHSPDMEARTITVDGEARPYWDQVSWLVPASLAGLPAVSVPVGVSAGGLPVGMQIVAPYLDDRTALDLARRTEHALGGFVAPPAFSPTTVQGG